jgi:peptidoglycan glycosyltransferase/penicillin-binding protein 2
MITTIANNGIRKKLNLVDAVVTDEGDIVKLIRREEDSRVISEEVAKEIQAMMHETTISGTGKNANLDEYGGSAGKTGSAETGWIVNGEAKVHAWFAGFFPVHHPKYAVVVFVENGRQGGLAAAPVFKEIGEKILDMY